MRERIKNQNFAVRKFVLNLIVFLIIVITSDQIIGRWLKRLYFKQNHGTLYYCTYIFDKLKSPVLIVGSSRAVHDYYPQIFEDSLKMNCFDTGLQGRYVFFYDVILQSIFKRYNPNLVVLDITPNELEKHPESYERLSFLLPYYSNYPQVRNSVLLKSKFERIKLFSAIYPYNSLILQSITGTLDLHNKEAGEKKLKGFLPDYTLPYNGKLNEWHYKNDIDTNFVNSLKSIVKACVKNKTKLVIIVSPTYTKYTNQSKSTSIVKRIAENSKITFWDYSQDPYFLSKPQLFYDTIHLNVSGAKLYSKMVAGRLKRSFKIN